VAGGLGFGSDNGKFFPGKEVHQGGFAYVRVAYDIDEAGAM